ncbi:transient receptor potential cation channel subfamily A member 1-like isoform X2 [Xenia sp. Carnegie-2017]|nr:transient receptor potential cation channel subfamily A member 1-like isoform X2 [Xenia sp. Carnegie-2017]
METKDSVVEMEDTNEATVVAASRWKLQNSVVLNPLIRAVRRGMFMTEQYLAEIKDIENLKIKDSDDFGRNIFHLSVQREKLLEFLLEKFKKHEQLMEALHSENLNGHTPAHVAVLHNQRKSLQILACADENVYMLRSSKTGQTLIHCAVYQTLIHCAGDVWNPCIVQDIISTRPQSLIDKDNKGKSPQHYAAALQECFVLNFLLSMGANILEMDNRESTLLHEAAEAGSLSNVMLLSRDEQTMLRARDVEGRTPLHIACAKGFRNIVSFLLENGADPLVKTNDHENCLEVAVNENKKNIVKELLLSSYWKLLICDWKNGPKKCFVHLIEKMPDQAKLLLDRCVVTSNHKPNSPDYNITYDFFLLGAVDGSNPPVFDALTAIIKNNEEQCLTHKLCKKYFSVKWREKGCHLYLINLTIFLSFHILFSVYVCLVRGEFKGKGMHDINKSRSNTSSSKSYVVPLANLGEVGPVIITYFIVVLTVFNIFREFVQMNTYRWKYFKLWSNYFEWLLFLCVLYFMFPIKTSKTEPQFSAAAIAIVISWLDFIWFLRRIPDTSTYILTFQKTFKTMMRMFILIMLFVMAFASPFYILMVEKPRFKSFPIAILSTFVSMLGDFKYDDLFLKISDFNAFYYLKLFMFVNFLLLMVLVVNNVLIGLAVGDTQYVMEMAKVERLKQHMKFMITVESSLFARLPHFRQRKHQSVYTEYPNCKTSFANYLKRFLAGEMNTFSIKRAEDEVETEVVTRQQFEEILNVKFEEHHEKMKELLFRKSWKI